MLSTISIWSRNLSSVMTFFDVRGPSAPWELFEVFSSFIYLFIYLLYITYTRGIPSAKALKYISIKNKYIKIQWMGLIFQGVVFEFNSAPQMYLEVFFELL